jgi:drug/metabolite transporter (DMT)-like permease
LAAAVLPRLSALPVGRRRPMLPQKGNSTALFLTGFDRFTKRKRRGILSPMKFNRSNPVLALLLCALLWSTGGILIKSVTWNSLAISGARSFIGAVLIICVLRRFPRIVVHNTDGKKDTKETAVRIGAALAYSATMILFVFANKLTTAANAILLQYTNPLWVILLGPVALKEKNTWVEYLTVLGVLGGMTLFALDTLEGGNILGDIIACASGVCFGVSIVLMRKQKNSNPSDSFVLAHILTFIVSLPFIFTSGMLSAQSVAGILALGVFQVGFPSILYSVGIMRITAISAVFCTMLEPLMNPVWVFLFTGEKPSLNAVLGGAVILGFIMFRTLFIYKKSLKRLS